jgi:hypothetical protein
MDGQFPLVIIFMVLILLQVLTLLFSGLALVGCIFRFYKLKSHHWMMHARGPFQGAQKGNMARPYQFHSEFVII